MKINWLLIRCFFANKACLGVFLLYHSPLLLYFFNSPTREPGSQIFSLIVLAAIEIFAFVFPIKFLARETEELYKKAARQLRRNGVINGRWREINGTAYCDRKGILMAEKDYEKKRNQDIKV